MGRGLITSILSGWGGGLGELSVPHPKSDQQQISRQYHYTLSKKML